MLPAELGDLLPQDADGNYLAEVVVNKNDKIRSTNPGQLYHVVTVTPYAPMDYFRMTDTWGSFFDLSPKKLGGGVEIIVVDSDGYATILTYEDGIELDLYPNDLKLWIDFDMSMGGPLEPDDVLMIYMKYKLAMKHEMWTYGPYVEFCNEVNVFWDGNYWPADGTMLLAYLK
jgi:hypothetical protein